MEQVLLKTDDYLRKQSCLFVCLKLIFPKTGVAGVPFSSSLAQMLELVLLKSRL